VTYAGAVVGLHAIVSVWKDKLAVDWGLGGEEWGGVGGGGWGESVVRQSRHESMHGSRIVQRPFG